MFESLFRQDRRQEPRAAQSCDVALLREGRVVGKARLVDLSEHGARLLGAPETIAGAHAFVLADRQQACSYEVIRTGFGGVGVRITLRRRLAAPAKRRA